MKITTYSGREDGEVEKPCVTPGNKGCPGIRMDLFASGLNAPGVLVSMSSDEARRLAGRLLTAASYTENAEANS